MSSLEMLLSDWLWFVDKTILALSGGHFEDFPTLSKNIHTYLRTSLPQAGSWVNGVRRGPPSCGGICCPQGLHHRERGRPLH